MSTKPSEGAVKAADDYDALKSDLASVTAERDAEFRRSDSELAAAAQKESALRAMAQARIDQLAARVAELEAALREIVECVDVDGADEKYDREIQRICAIALARAESATPDHIPDAAKMVSATPAKHPDTVRLDWLESAPSERLAEVRRVLWQQHNTCMATRSAIDAARKQEASK